MKNIFSIIFLIMIILIASFLVYDGLLNNGNIVWSKAYRIITFSQISDQEWAEKYNAHPIVLAYKEKYNNVTLTQDLGYHGKYLDYTVSNSTNSPSLHIWIVKDRIVHFSLKCDNPRTSSPITVSMQVDSFSCSNRDTIEGRGFTSNQQSEQEELLEIQNTHCSGFAKYNYLREYVSDENESVAKQRLLSCYNQNQEESSMIYSSTCHELFLISENNFEGLEFSNSILTVHQKITSCLDSEKTRANVGSCESLRQRYVTGEPYLDIANRLLTEQRMKDICHYNLVKEFGNIYE